MIDRIYASARRSSKAAASVAVMFFIVGIFGWVASLFSESISFDYRVMIAMVFTMFAFTFIVFFVLNILSYVFRD